MSTEATSGAYSLESLEPGRSTREQWLAQCSAFVQDLLDGAAQAPAIGLLGPEAMKMASELQRDIPEAPLPGGLPQVIQILERALGLGVNPAGPGCMAYINGGGLYTAALADFMADCFNRYTGLAAAAPGLCRLEADVLAWLAQAFGYGPEARGLLTTGGSMANFSAVVTARHAHVGESGDLRRAMVYASSQAHHSVLKAAHLAGIPMANVRTVAVDARFRMDVSALERAIAEDRARDLQPFLVVSSAGTTNTGAVDPLPAIADLCANQGLWHHVDAAYGGAFVLCEEGRARLAGLERADSLAFDPHKGMFLPFGTGCLMVRDGEALRRAHHVGAGYLHDLDTSAAPPSATEYGPELSREFRGLRLWLSLMLFGAGAFRAALAEKLELARRFHRGLEELIAAGVPIEIVDAPQLSTVPFRLMRRPGEELDAWNRRNTELLAGIHRRKRVFLSSMLLPSPEGEIVTLRVCVMSFRVHEPQIQACLEDLAAEASTGSEAKAASASGAAATP